MIQGLIICLTIGLCLGVPQEAVAASGSSALAEGREEAKTPQQKKPASKKSEKAEETPSNVDLKNPIPEVQEALPATAAPDQTGKAQKSKLVLKHEEVCTTIEFVSKPGMLISCTEKLPLEYKKRDCGTSQVLESGKTDALVACEDKKKLSLLFKMTDVAVSAKLRVQRVTQGRSGVKTQYYVENVSQESSGVAKHWPEPKVLKIEEPQPVETPLQFKFSGFVSVEHERTSNFGYDVGSTGTPTQVAVRNFDKNAIAHKQANTSIFSNASFELGKDRTSFVSTFEVGEIFFGDSYSGGGVGARSGTIFEVRNLFLNHEFTDSLNAKGGVVTTSSDPRSFIFSVHIASIQANYKTDLSEGLIWCGNASQNKTGADKLLDQYFGAQGTLGFLSGIKANVFGLYRRKGADQFAVDDGTGAGTFTTVNGDSSYRWIGGTFEYDRLNPLSVQATFIYNFNHSRLSDGKTDEMNASLFDVKMSYVLESPNLTFTAEVLGTTGASGVIESTTGKPYLNKRKNFISPVGAAYLATIATSDGVDDSAGTPKQSIIGNLNIEEGLRAVVLTTSANLMRNITGFIRYGMFRTAHESQAQRSNRLGDELDVGGIYQLTPSTLLQVDYGFFQPGGYYAKRDAAQLFSTKLKFSF